MAGGVMFDPITPGASAASRGRSPPDPRPPGSRPKTTEERAMRTATRAMVLGSLMALVMALPAAWAGQANPHFVGTPTCSKSNAGLSCSGKAAGLDGLVTSAFVTAGQVAATWECVNRGGNVAPGQPTVVNLVNGPIQNVMPRNGNITFKVGLPAPAKPSAAGG